MMSDTVQNDLEATLARMRAEFIDQLPARQASLQAQLQAVERGEPEALQTFHRAAHSLVGSAGVHRLLPISEAARALEHSAAAQPRDQALSPAGLKALRQGLARLLQVMVQPEAPAPAPPPLRSAGSRIAVVDDDAEQAQWMRSVLEAAGYPVDVYAALEPFRAACQQGELPAAVIMDMVFPEGCDAGARLISELKAQSLSGLPVVFASVRQDMAARLAAYRAGATRYLTKPLARDTLLRVVADSVTLVPDQPYRVLMVDDDADQLRAHARMLRQAGLEVCEVNDPLQAAQVLAGFDAEALVLDMYMPQCSGPELAAVLSDDERFAELPIIYLSAETNISLQLVALDRGGDHFLTKPVDSRHLVAAVSLHARRLRQTREQAQALRESLYERERQEVAVNAHAIVSRTDAQGVITYVNDKFCAISGYGRDELLGSNHRIVKSGEHSPAFYAGMWDAISQGRIWQGQVCNRGKDGHLYWVDTTIVPFLDAGGLPYQYISIRTDVTYVMAAEQRLKKIVSRVPGMVYQFRRAPDGSVSFPFVSDGIQGLLGFLPGEVYEDASRAFAEVHPDDLPALYQSTEVSARDLVPWRQEFRLHPLPDGRTRWMQGDALPEREPDGAVLWHGFITEVTARKQTEKELQQAKEAAETASLAKSEFLASMSHELRTPLNAILGFSQIFGLDPRLAADQREHAREIENAGTHLLSLVNGIMDLARIEAGQMELSMESVPLGRVLQEGLSMLAPLAAKQGIALHGGYAPCEHATVRADFVRLRQVVINLLSNAVKYNRAGGAVQLLCGVAQGRIRVRVQDTGRGIAADKQDRIFNAFDRLGAERSNIEGTGIGLVLTKRMVEAMGGRIGFESVEGQGSTFWFEFALEQKTAPAPTGAPGAGGSAAVPVPVVGAQASPVVLYVEDNPMNLRLMQQIFTRRKDLELRGAPTAEIGIAQARAEMPALILMDINLPGMDGYEALVVLKADATTAAIPVLAVSANAMQGDRERGLQAGFADYVSKPLDVPHFLDLLARWCPGPGH